MFPPLGLIMCIICCSSCSHPCRHHCLAQISKVNGWFLFHFLKLSWLCFRVEPKCDQWYVVMSNNWISPDLLILAGWVVALCNKNRQAFPHAVQWRNCHGWIWTGCTAILLYAPTLCYQCAAVCGVTPCSETVTSQFSCHTLSNPDLRWHCRSNL